MSDSVRIDVWLWAVRIYKTRAQAAKACRLNQVMVAGQHTKASRAVRIGDTIQVDKDHLVRTLKVQGLVEKRVGAKLVTDLLEDLTPADEIAHARRRREEHRANKTFRWPGASRPTKKDRRDIEKLSGDSEPSP